MPKKKWEVRKRAHLPRSNQPEYPTPLPPLPADSRTAVENELKYCKVRGSGVGLQMVEGGDDGDDVVAVKRCVDEP